MFTPPTLQQVIEYASSIGFIDLDAQYFINYYSIREWMVPFGKKGKVMSNWKNAVQLWKHKRDKENEGRVVKANVVIEAEAIRIRLLAGEHVSHFEKNKLPYQKQTYLVEDDNKKWYLPKND